MHMSTNHVMTCTQYTKTQIRLIRIHIISRIQRMLALVVAFTALSSCSIELFVPMSQPPHTRANMLYMRLTNSLERQDAILTLNPY